MTRKIDNDTSHAQKVLSAFCLLLFSRHWVSLSQLAEFLHCSKQTVLRIVADIEASGKVTVEKSLHSGRRLFRVQGPSHGLPSVFLEDEVRLLALCRDLVRHILPSQMDAAMGRTLFQAAGLLNDTGNTVAILEPVGGVAVKGKIDYTPFHDFLSTLTEAISTRRVCDISYQKVTAYSPEGYEVIPVRLLSYHDTLYIQAWKVTSTGTPLPLESRVLAVQRMYSVSTQRRTATELPSLPLPGDEAFGFIRDEPFQVRAVFAPPVSRYIRERTWSDDQTLLELDNDSIELCFTARSRAEVRGWILGFGAKAEVLEPAWLRERLAEEVRKLAVRYNA